MITIVLKTLTSSNFLLYGSLNSLRAIVTATLVGLHQTKISSHEHLLGFHHVKFSFYKASRVCLVNVAAPQAVTLGS